MLVGSMTYGGLGKRGPFGAPDFTTFTDILHGNPCVKNFCLRVVDMSSPAVLLFPHNG